LYYPKKKTGVITCTAIAGAGDCEKKAATAIAGGDLYF